MDTRRFFNQFLALFSGTAVAQLFNLASYPLLARLYTPTDFGLFGTFVAASAIPGAVACGRFELAIATAPEEGRRGILWLCFLVALGTSMIATLLASLWWFHTATPAIATLVPAMFLATLLTGISNATSMYLIRHDAFRSASTAVVIRTACTVIAQLGFAHAGYTATGLVVGFCIGLIAQAAFGLVMSKRSLPFGGPQMTEIRAMFARFRGQVSVDLPSTLLSAFSFNLIPFVLQFLFGIRAVGYYSVGQRIAVLPLQLFNDSLSQVFFQRAARAQEERGEFWREFRLTLFWSGLLSLGMLFGLLFLAEPVVTIYLGPGWEMAGTILVLLAPMLAIRSVTMSLATTVFVLNKPAWLLYHNIGSVAAIALTFGCGWFYELGLSESLGLLAFIQSMELAVFGLIIGRAAYRNYRLSRHKA